VSRADEGPVATLVVRCKSGGSCPGCGPERLTGVGKLRVIAFRARIWRPATRNAGLDGLRIHDLRHTAVALWIAAGANPKEVAARAGHTSVSFTLDRYGHLYPGSDAALRDRLDAIYSAGQRDQDAAVVDLFQERSRTQRHPRTRGTPPTLGR
jgi:Phage integrase family